MKKLLSQIPSINSILLRTEIQELMSKYPEATVKKNIKQEVDRIKENIFQIPINELNTFTVPKIEDMIKNIEERVLLDSKCSLKKVINATGTILHTNLGRSILSEKVKDNLFDVGFNYSNLEFNVNDKNRGSRYSHLIKIIKELTDAEDAIVVNNNAAAVMLTLNTLANAKDVIVSRGELVEIGGSFRIPEIIKLSGCNLKEVGTTNKTHYEDYENEINEETGVMLKVHTSNYKIIGFTKSIENKELVELSRKNEIISIIDLGSGQLVDLRKYGLPYEPTVREIVKTGFDVVTFSGDKLLGGPQAGIILGKKEYIEKIKKNQLTRVLRIDKLTLSALESTLKIYLDEEKAIKEIPTLRMISYNKRELMDKAFLLSEKIDKSKYNIYINDKDVAEIGGGSYPEACLNSVSINLIPLNKSSIEIEKKLRKNNIIPIITRIKGDKLILDMRTIDEKDFDIIKDVINLFG